MLFLKYKVFILLLNAAWTRDPSLHQWVYALDSNHISRTRQFQCSLKPNAKLRWWTRRHDVRDVEELEMVIWYIWGPGSHLLMNDTFNTLPWRAFQIFEIKKRKSTQGHKRKIRKQKSKTCLQNLLLLSHFLFLKRQTFYLVKNREVRILSARWCGHW